MPDAATPPATEARIKGVAFERLLDFYTRRHGEARMNAIVGSLPPDLAAHLHERGGSHGVLVNAWYPARLAHGLLDAMTASARPAERTELAEAGAEAIVRSSLRGIYKVLFQLFMTPDRYAGRAQALWDRYFDTGRVEKTIVDEKTHVTRIEDWSGHHPVLCEMNAASARIIYEELGCRAVRVERTGCVSRGDPACTQRITWD